MPVMARIRHQEGYMYGHPLHLTSPAAFFAFAQDDPDRWERIQGRKIHHYAKGVGVITSIVEVTYDAGQKKSCGGIFVAFDHGNDLRPDRFNPTAFEDGTFTAFVVDTQEVIQHIRDAFHRLALAEASHLHDCYRTQLDQASFDYETEARPYLTLCDLLRGHGFAQADAFFAKRDVMVDARAYEQSKAEWLIDYFRHQERSGDRPRQGTSPRQVGPKRSCHSQGGFRQDHTADAPYEPPGRSVRRRSSCDSRLGLQPQGRPGNRAKNRRRPSTTHLF